MDVQRMLSKCKPTPPPPTATAGDGGSNVAWSPDGREIYYVQPPGPPWVLMAVDVTPGDEFQAGRPAPLIDPWTFYGLPPIQWTGKCLSFVSVPHPRWSQKLPLRQRRRGVEGS